MFDPIPLELTGTIQSVTGTNGMDYINSVAGSTLSIFGNSLYKVTCTVNDVIEAVFFLDTRDCNYPSINSDYAYNDFTIKYIHSEKRFYITEGKGVQFNSPLFTEVTDKIVTLWEIEGIQGPVTECFEDYLENCLGITEYINFPRLVWGPIPNFNATNYKVYRAISC